MQWAKSSYSGPNGGNCVEWSVGVDGVYVRDSKDPDGAHLFYTFDEWAAFTRAVKDGQADLKPILTAEPVMVWSHAESPKTKD